MSAHGIIHFLALLERLWRVVRPVIAEYGGRPLREDADDLFAVFPDVTSALACARAIHEHVEIANGPLPAANEIYVALGIGYGRLRNHTRAHQRALRPLVPILSL